MRIAPEAGDRRSAITNQRAGFRGRHHVRHRAARPEARRQNETFAVSYATEAGLFQVAGAPSVVCGPGDIAQAHTANELVARSELDACMGFLMRLADWAEA